MIAVGIAAVFAAYLIGSLNFAVIFSKAFLKQDIRELGSGNAGSTNMLRSAGLLPGLLTFVCDALKGAIACFMGQMIFEWLAVKTGAAWAAPLAGAYVCGLACMTGHIFPIFFRFKGGKGVAVSVGIYALCCAPAIAIGLAAFVLTVLITRYVSLGSIIAAVIVVSLSLVFYHAQGNFAFCAICSVTMGLMVLLKHRTNMVRLLKHQESKFTVRKS